MRRLVLALACTLLVLVPTAANAREPLDIGVFAKIGPPGQPEPVAIGPDGRVYVGTNQLGHGDAEAPSKVFAFSQGGQLLRSYELQGQPLAQDHGIQGLAFDRDGLLYVLDRSADPRVVVLDPATGEQRTYARFRDVPPCSGAPDGTCSDTTIDNPPAPDYAAFSATGELYVTDIDQALIWKVPRGGGRPELWLTGPRFESVYGPNGIGFMADGRTLLFVNTASNPNAGDPLSGRLYTVPVERDGSPGPLTQVWESLPLDAPDGFAIARSGNVYVALAGTNQIVELSPQFTELARVPADPVANQTEEVPLDGPASLAFLGDRLLVTNHSPIRGDPSSWAVLDLFAGEPGLPLLYPRIVRPQLRLAVRRVRGKQRDSRSGSRKRIRLRVRVTRFLAADETPVRGAKVRARGTRARTNKRGKATLRVRRGSKRTIIVRAKKRGFDSAAVPVHAG